MSLGGHFKEKKTIPGVAVQATCAPAEIASAMP